MKRPRLRLQVVLEAGLRMFMVLLPAGERHWLADLAGELAAIPSTREQLQFAFSAFRALCVIGVAARFRSWSAQAQGLAVAAALSVATATIDLASDTRWPLRIAVGLSAIVAGALAPRAALLAGVIVGMGLPLATAISGYSGPYASDTGDVWFPLLPAVVLSALAGWLTSRRSGAQRAR